MRIDSSGNVGIGTSTNNVFDQVSGGRPLVVQSSSSSTTVGGSTNSITICNSDITTSNTSQLNFAAITGASTNQYSSAIISAIHGARTNGQYPTGQLVFSTSSSTNAAPTEKMRIDSSGNIGVGVTGGNGRINILAPANAIALQINGRSSDNAGGLYAYDTTGATQYSTLIFTATETQISSIPAAANITFRTNAAERMRIDSSGNVGIATTSPSYMLSLGNGTTSVNNQAVLFLQSGNGSGGARDFSIEGDGSGALLFKDRGYNNANNGNGELMRINYSGNVGIGTSSPTSKLEVYDATSAVARVTAGTEIFEIRNTGSEVRLAVISADPMTFRTSNVEAMRIDSSGNVLVGATSTQGGGASVFSLNSSSANPLQVQNTNNSSPYGAYFNFSAAAPNNATNYFLICNDTGGTKFKLLSNGGLANFQANDSNLSDKREKTNFSPAKDYLDIICAIPVQTFNYIDQNIEEDDGLTLGVIAQDVQAVAPELVSESDWGTKEDPKMRLSIYQTDLQYALMKCIQELKAENDSLKARLDAAGL